MSANFSEKMLDSMVNEDGHCGDRGLSPRQFDILSGYLTPGPCRDAGSWRGYYKTIYFTSQNYEGIIGKYYVVLNECWHFHRRCTVVSIDRRPQDEIDAENAEKERLRKLRDFSKSEWQFEPKQRVDLDLVLVNDFQFTGTSYSYYDDGKRHIYTFRDQAGNCYVWKTSNFVGVYVTDDKGRDNWVGAEVGDKVFMRATVKEHGEYKGIKQTIINRPKISAVEKQQEGEDE